MKYAQVPAERLNHIGYQAVAVPQDIPLTGDLNVTGRIAAVRGGNTAARVLVGFGAGHSEFDVSGTVTRADGTLVGDFTESRAGDDLAGSPHAERKQPSSKPCNSPRSGSG